MNDSIARIRNTNVYSLRVTVPADLGDELVHRTRREAGLDTDNVLSGLAITNSTWADGIALVSFRISGISREQADARALAVAEAILDGSTAPATLTTGVGVNRRLVAEQ